MVYKSFIMKSVDIVDTNDISFLISKLKNIIYNLIMKSRTSGATIKYNM